MCNTHAAKYWNKPLTRRGVLGVFCSVVVPLCIGLPACTKRRYKRPFGDLDLGPVRSLLYAKVHVRSRSVMVYRDKVGWSALSTRCTLSGCDLSLSDELFLCPCCKSRYGLQGNILSGSAPEPLPWIGMHFANGHLYANPGNVVLPSHRFTTPEIEKAIDKLRDRMREEVIADEILVPEILLGKGDREMGGMFLEDDDITVDDLNMIR